jgi:hypothetical protein
MSPDKSRSTCIATCALGRTGLNWLWVFLFPVLRQNDHHCRPLFLVQFTIAEDMFLRLKPITTFAFSRGHNVKRSRLSWSYTVLLPSDAHTKPITSIAAVLLPFVTYLLALYRTIKIGAHSAYNGIPDFVLQSSLYLDLLRTKIGGHKGIIGLGRTRRFNPYTTHIVREVSGTIQFYLTKLNCRRTLMYSDNGTMIWLQYRLLWPGGIRSRPNLIGTPSASDSLHVRVNLNHNHNNKDTVNSTKTNKSPQECFKIVQNFWWLEIYSFVTSQ